MYLKLYVYLLKYFTPLKSVDKGSKLKYNEPHKMPIKLRKIL